MYPFNNNEVLRVIEKYKNTKILNEDTFIKIKSNEGYLPMLSVYTQDAGNIPILFEENSLILHLKEWATSKSFEGIQLVDTGMPCVCDLTDNIRNVKSYLKKCNKLCLSTKWIEWSDIPDSLISSNFEKWLVDRFDLSGIESLIYNPQIFNPNIRFHATYTGNELLCVRCVEVYCEQLYVPCSFYSERQNINQVAFSNALLYKYAKDNDIKYFNLGLDIFPYKKQYTENVEYFPGFRFT